MSNMISELRSVALELICDPRIVREGKAAARTLETAFNLLSCCRALRLARGRRILLGLKPSSGNEKSDGEDQRLCHNKCFLSVGLVF
jgi:hypothetical protein